MALVVIADKSEISKLKVELNWLTFTIKVVHTRTLLPSLECTTKRATIDQIHSAIGKKVSIIA